MMHAFSISLMLATLGCALVAGITLTFAIVVIPGLRTLGDRALLEGFKAIDRIIQDNHPVFMLVWIGSAGALIITTVLGFFVLEGADLALLVSALVIYLCGVQLATILVNIPLNNRLQETDLSRLDAAGLSSVREEFEPRWLRWNGIRTWLAIVATIMLLMVLLRI
jgi:uncharacterized membrane protein